MTGSKQIVLDANILIRAVLGERVSGLLTRYCERTRFYTVEQCYAEARKHLPVILEKRLHTNPTLIMDALDRLTAIVQPIPPLAYERFEKEAKLRIGERDPNDWPLVALSLVLDCPVWTEDKDFFGVGVAVWNTRNIEVYLSNP